MPLSEEVRRLVTYVNEEGKAVALFDGNNPHKRVRPQRGTVSRLLWVTNETPAAINEPVDRAAVEIGVAPPRGGSIFASSICRRSRRTWRRCRWTITPPSMGIQRPGGICLRAIR